MKRTVGADGRAAAHLGMRVRVIFVRCAQHEAETSSNSAAKEVCLGQLWRSLPFHAQQKSEEVPVTQSKKTRVKRIRSRK